MRQDVQQLLRCLVTRVALGPTLTRNGCIHGYGPDGRCDLRKDQGAGEVMKSHGELGVRREMVEAAPR